MEKSNFLSEMGAEKPRYSILENTVQVVGAKTVVITEVASSVDAEVFRTSLGKS